MSPAARSVFAFGVYLGVGGIALMFLPHRLCDTFGLRSPDDTLWVRVCGVLLVDLAHYCIRAARNEHIRFIRWTVPPRLLTLPILGVVVASGLENASILVFGVVDALAALWTLFALPRRGAVNVLTCPSSLRHARGRRCAGLTARKSSRRA